MLPWITWILCALAVLSHWINLWQWLAGLRFPLHQRRGGTDFAPAISILKPLKGADATTTVSLKSWLEQAYPGNVQILFGVHNPQDPVVPIVQQLLQEFPNVDAQLLFCLKQPGANAKVGTLIQLEPHAKYELLIVSDADIRIPQDFLSEFVQPFNPVAGNHAMVNCFYAHANPTTVAQQWEALSMNADFWSQVLQSISMTPQDFALGAVMGVRRDTLNQIGGFLAVANHLADDFQLGQRAFRQVGKLALCPVVVQCWDAPAGWREVWNHQLRWSRTVRVCRPLPYAASIISNVTFWTLLAMAVGHRQSWLLLGGSVVLGLRVSMARGLAQRLGSWSPSALQSLWLVPLRDLLGVLIWALAFFGSTVTWRDVAYRVRSDGTLAKI